MITITQALLVFGLIVTILLMLMVAQFYYSQSIVNTKLDTALARIASAREQLDEQRALITSLTDDKLALLEINRALEAKLDICKRYAEMEGADGDFAKLANDYGGLNYERDPAVLAVGNLQQRLVTELERQEVAAKL